MPQDVSRAIATGAYGAFSLAGVLAIFATLSIPPWRNPAIPVKALAPIFILLAFSINLASNRDVYLVLFKFWGWLG